MPPDEEESLEDEVGVAPLMLPIPIMEDMPDLAVGNGRDIRPLPIMPGVPFAPGMPAAGVMFAPAGVRATAGWEVTTLG